MKHLSRAALSRKLKSPHTSERRFAAEELGARRDRDAVAPLVAVLATIQSSHDDGLFVAEAALDALGAIGDLAATSPILRILRIAGGVTTEDGRPFLAEAGCGALARLRDPSAVPGVRELLTRRSASSCGGLLARTLAELGGVEEAAFFAELLALPDLEVKRAGIVGLGQLRHLPSAPALQALLEAEPVWLRQAALGGLLAMDAPGSEARLRDEARRASSLRDKEQIRFLFAEHSLRSKAGVLLELADDPAWADTPVVYFNTLELAVTLGSAAAAARVLQLLEDPAQAWCARARSAGILLVDGQARWLPLCLEYLRRSYVSPDDLDGPREPPARHYATQREVIDALERYGRGHRDARAQIATCLHQIICHGDHADLESSTYYLAGNLLGQLTGTCCDSELAQWFKAQREES